MPELPQEADDRDFRQIHREYSGKIYTMIFRLVGDADTAEDLMLETFLTANRRWKDFDRTQRVSTWLHAIAFEALKAHFRMRDRRDIIRPDAPK